MENKLPENFRAKNFRFTQIERNKSFALYLKENDVEKESKDYFFCYEVIKIKKQKAHSSVIEGKEVYRSAKEIYPNTKDWGLSGWTFKTFPEAKAYFINLTDKVAHSSQGIVKTENLTISLTNRELYQFLIHLGII